MALNATQSDGRVSQDPPRPVAQAIPRSGVLRSAGRHRQSDPQLDYPPRSTSRSAGRFRRPTRTTSWRTRSLADLSGVQAPSTCTCTRSSAHRGSCWTHDRRSPADGLTAQDGNSVSISLSGSGTATTNFWLNYENGVNCWSWSDRTTPRQLDGRPPPHADRQWTAGRPQLLGNLATFSRTTPLSLRPLQRAAGLRRLRGVQGTDLGRCRIASTPSSRNTTRRSRRPARSVAVGSEHEAVVLPDGASESASRSCSCIS